MLALQSHMKLLFFFFFNFNMNGKILMFDKDHKNRNSNISSWRYVWLQAFEDILFRAFREFQMFAPEVNSKMLNTEVASRNLYSRLCSLNVNFRTASLDSSHWRISNYIENLRFPMIATSFIFVKSSRQGEFPKNNTLDQTRPNINCILVEAGIGKKPFFET